MVQLNLRSIHRSQLVNVSKKDGGKTCDLDIETNRCFELEKFFNRD